MSLAMKMPDYSENHLPMPDKASLGGGLGGLPQPPGRDRDDPKARFLGCHVSRNDVDNFLHHSLSETKTALVERHLASCAECSDLMLVILERHASRVTTWHGTFENDPIQD
jgi:hypothetical protein